MSIEGHSSGGLPGYAEWGALIQGAFSGPPGPRRRGGSGFDLAARLGRLHPPASSGEDGTDRPLSAVPDPGPALGGAVGPESPAELGGPWDREALRADFTRLRRSTEALCDPLEVEDYCLQVAVETSPRASTWPMCPGSSRPPCYAPTCPTTGSSMRASSGTTSSPATGSSSPPSPWRTGR